ncbi:MAG: nuclear transport factor 2 family protein [Solirubrobacteraceae bacterium]
MSRENVEVVRLAVEAWQRDDLETWLSLMDPDVEYHTAIERGLEGGASVYRGHDGIREFWTLRRTEVEDYLLESQELRDLPNGRVLHLTHIRWRGAASGIELESPLGMVVTVRGGKIVRSVHYLSHEEALEAVGLRE